MDGPHQESRGTLGFLLPFGFPGARANVVPRGAGRTTSEVRLCCKHWGDLGKVTWPSWASVFFSAKRISTLHTFSSWFSLRSHTSMKMLHKLKDASRVSGGPSSDPTALPCDFSLFGKKSMGAGSRSSMRRLFSLSRTVIGKRGVKVGKI